MAFETVSFTLDSSFGPKAKKHPKGDLVAAESFQWVQDHHVGSEKDITYLGGLSTHCYPSASDKRMQLACDFENLSFLLRGFFDTLRKDTQSMIGRMTEIQTSATESGLEGLASDFWTRFSKNAPPSLQFRIKKHLRSCLRSVAISRWYQTTGTTLDFDSYTALRREQSGFKAHFDMVEFCEGVSLSREELVLPELRAMLDAANDILCRFDDLLSCNTEQGKKNSTNIVTLLATLYKIDTQSAIDQTAQMCKESITTFRNAKAALSAQRQYHESQNLAKVVRGLEDYIIGHCHWSKAVDNDGFDNSAQHSQSEHEVDLNVWFELKGAGSSRL